MCRSYLVQQTRVVWADIASFRAFSSIGKSAKTLTLKEVDFQGCQPLTSQSPDSFPLFVYTYYVYTLYKSFAICFVDVRYYLLNIYLKKSYHIFICFGLCMTSLLFGLYIYEYNVQFIYVIGILHHLKSIEMIFDLT